MACCAPRQARKMPHDFGSIDIRSVLDHVTIPVLVLHCRSDAIVPLEAGRQFAIHLPDVRFVVLEGENHVLLENDPGWPVFLAEVRSFLAELSG
jgi:pimeloyl-ACP methyl ester carboxylesterase